MTGIEKRNLLADLPDALADEVFEPLLVRRGLTLERILSRGHSTERGQWYDQQQDEWVVLLTGKAKLELDGGETIEMVAGDTVLLPARCRHRVAWTDPDQVSVWLALHLDPERGGEYDDDDEE